MRFWIVCGTLAGLCILSFIATGDLFVRLFDQQASAAWFAEIRPYAWLAAILLLVGDLVLPVPATGVMAALGSVYGVAIGGLVGAVGSILAAAIGYGAARWLGRPVTRWMASEEDHLRFQDVFDQWGGAAVIASRALPVLPEVLSVMAGLARMHAGHFFTAVVLGTTPVAFFYSTIGYAAASYPWYGWIVAAGLPLLLWPVFLVLQARRGRSGVAPTEKSEGELDDRKGTRG